jgi:hypothetical protein
MDRHPYFCFVVAVFIFKNLADSQNVQNREVTELELMDKARADYLEEAKKARRSRRGKDKDETTTLGNMGWSGDRSMYCKKINTRHYK